MVVANMEHNRPVLRVVEELGELLLILRYGKVFLQERHFHPDHELQVLVEWVLPADFPDDDL